MSTHCVDLAHDGLETRQTRGEEEAAERQGGVEVVSHGEQMPSRICAGDDDNLIAAAAIVLLVVVAIVSGSWRILDLVVAESAIGVCACCTHGDDLLLVGGGVGGRGEDFVLDGVQTADDNGLVDACVRHLAGRQGQTNKQLAICLGKELDKPWEEMPMQTRRVGEG